MDLKVSVQRLYNLNVVQKGQTSTHLTVRKEGKNI